MVLTKGFFMVREWARQLWVRVALLAALAFISAAIAPIVSGLLPGFLKDRINEDATLALLDVLTNSMLVVATFSLTVMVSAHHFASSQVTPRSHRLLREDGRTQQALATYIGAFVFAVTSRILIDIGQFDPGDVGVVYILAILVTAMVVLSLLRWIGQLAGLGSVEKTSSRIENAVSTAIDNRMKAPWLGCTRLDEDQAHEGTPLPAGRYGYVKHIDIPGLANLANDNDLRIDLNALPGDWIGTGDALMHVRGDIGSEELRAELVDKMVLGELRSFEQDPLFGFEVMSEIGQRALSPGLNDPRTAVDIVRRQSRLLGRWHLSEESAPEPRLRARAVNADRLIETAFDAIARDGADQVEVQLAVQTALTRMTLHEDPSIRSAAQHVSRRALERSDTSLVLQSDRDRVRDAAPAEADYSAASR